MGLGSERLADFVRLFKLWDMVQYTGNSLRLGCWIVAVAAVVRDYASPYNDTQYFI